MNLQARIYVAGGDTLAGRALVAHLRDTGHTGLVGLQPYEPDLTRPDEVEDFFADSRPEYVFLAAGLSGGIALNQARPADLMRDNLLVTANVLHAAHQNRVRRLLYLGSSCSYPRLAAQPLREESLLTGPLEPTSEPYAMARIAGWQLCQAYRKQFGDDFITGIPANCFGPGDDFNPETGHVIPSLIARMHRARVQGERKVTLWGTGVPRREFLFSRDLADACVHVMRNYSGDAPINLGGGQDASIREIAELIASVVGFTGVLLFDPSRPDGAPLKMLDSSRLRELGWRTTTDLRRALTTTYNWYLQHAMEGHRDDSGSVQETLAHSARRGGDRSRLSL